MVNHTHRILIVDDEPLNLLLLSKILLPKFEVTMASSGEEALAILNRETFSMIITDQRMPGMTGTELLRRARATDQDLICMMVTSEKDASVFVEAIMNSGAIKVINKPWIPDQVRQTIEEALERYEHLLANRKSLDKLINATQKLDRIVKEE